MSLLYKIEGKELSKYAIKPIELESDVVDSLVICHNFSEIVSGSNNISFIVVINKDVKVWKGNFL